MNLLQSRSSTLAFWPSPKWICLKSTIPQKTAIFSSLASRIVVVKAAERDAVTVQNWDIVVLDGLEGSKPSLGRVLVAGDATHTIELLEEETKGEFAVTGIEQEIKAEHVVSVITDFDYKQVQVDRAINPHGEHAEEIFTIPITSLPN